MLSRARWWSVRTPHSRSPALTDIIIELVVTPGGAIVRVRATQRLRGATAGRDSLHLTFREKSYPLTVRREKGLTRPPHAAILARTETNRSPAVQRARSKYRSSSPSVVRMSTVFESTVFS